MMRLGCAFGGVVLSVFLSISLTAQSKGDKLSTLSTDDRDSTPAIASVVLSADQTILFVSGSNLDRRSIVVLGGLMLGGIEISEDGTRLTALMPALSPGTY